METFTHLSQLHILFLWKNAMKYAGTFEKY
jgi:hypothetical protein